jgi:hypothetical protein
MRLSNWGGVKDDSPKYVDRIKMTYDPSLPKDTAEIIFEGYIVESDFFLFICGVKLKYQSDDTITLSRNLHPSGDGATSANPSTSVPSNGIGGKG